jgi:hypothetical protein
MANQWYYGQAGDKHGPFSALQLKELAATGHIRRTDTVWKEGVERGFLAANVGRLFAPAAAEAGSETNPAHAIGLSSDKQSDTGSPIEGVRPAADSVSTPSASPDATTAVAPESGTSAAEPTPAQENPTVPASAEPQPSEGHNEDKGSAAETSTLPPPGNGRGPESPTALAGDRSGSRKPETRKARASVITGAVIVRVEATTVVYRKKCASCGHEDASQCRIPIRNGVTRLTFFCPKCRKPRPVQIQCVA